MFKLMGKEIITLLRLKNLLNWPYAYIIFISSVSSSRLEEVSPEQPASRTSVIHDVRISSRPQPHMFGFMPLQDATDMQTTDSETSDVTESTDMSESGDNSIGMLHSSGSSSIAAFTPVKPSHL